MLSHGGVIGASGVTSGASSVTQTGSVFLGTTGSQSVATTVPSDAEIAMIFGRNYVEPTGAPTLGGQAAMLILHGYRCSLYFLISPPSGAQTLLYSPALGFEDVYEYGVAFFKGVNTSSPIRASAQSTTSDITGMTYQTGDMMLGSVVGNYPTIYSAADSGQTEVVNYLDGNGRSHNVGIKNSVGDFYFSCDDLWGAVACVIAKQ